MTAEAATTSLVRQEHDYGCGLASLAMIAGKSYNEIREWLLANWPGGHEQPENWLTKRGIHSGIADWYLSQHGYVWRTLYAGWRMPVWPPKPFAPVHLAMVRQPSGNSHYVVMRADGVVLDPMTDEPRTLADWEKVDNVQGIWPEATMLRRQIADELKAKAQREARAQDYFDEAMHDGVVRGLEDAAEFVLEDVS